MPDAKEMSAESFKSRNNWVSTATAAAALGVSERTVLRRAAAGKIESRKETTARGVVTMVALADVEVRTGADAVRTGADRVTTGADASLTAHLMEENRFLRATIEQHQRSEAELRASLREALKAMPKQLTQGEAPLPPPNPVEPPKRAEIAPDVITPDIEQDELEALIHKVFK